MNIVKFISVFFLIFIHGHIAIVTDCYMFTNTSSIFAGITGRCMFIGYFIMILPPLGGYVFAGKKITVSNIIGMSSWIVAINAIMNVLLFGVRGICSWNSLFMFSASFVGISLFARFSTRVCLSLLSFVSLLCVVAAPDLRQITAQYKTFYLVGAFFWGSWPLVPWFGLVGLGFVYARFTQLYNGYRQWHVGSLAVGLALVVFALHRGQFNLPINYEYFWDAPLFHLPVATTLSILGFFLIVTSVGNMWFPTTPLRKYGIVNCYSKGIIQIYVTNILATHYIFARYKHLLFSAGYFPVRHFSYTYFISLICLLLFGWLIGFLSIRLWKEKRIIIVVKKHAPVLQ